MIEEKSVNLTFPSGKKGTYILSKIPAFEGREILCQYPLTALPKVGDYSMNAELSLKIMSYVQAVPDIKDAQPVRLTTPQVINNHVPGAVELLMIEREMINYNFGFFLEEKAFDFFETLLKMIEDKVSSMLTLSSPPSSTMEKPPLKN